MKEQTNMTTNNNSIEAALAGMSYEQRREAIDRIEHANATAQHNEREAALRAQVEAATEASLKGNQWLQMQQSGQLRSGQALTEGQAKIAAAAAAQPMNGNAPQALVDQLPVTVGGIQLGPQQAKDMLARGEITRADYVAGVNAALAPYGHSFN
ncbi:MAG: hypothetical protein E5Y32_22850 [Mesorhizobium sp.]|jgi:hypothetical protein|uniref:hypothetical protein n=1 Tax=Mesorhizobium sp. TaxID=1871066 RepID=UPI001204870D|nr:hypothetical protein [Mesorhizobium sp.]TIL44961.1 MAG: hypothetical protein E5Y86_13810 [Mesorhizobium sp.]TIL60361.1 MAG: hypothetical protein E5Y79_10740 [Mesorhizobium sp.]TIM09555.1 MAG: hypothetical protein E5Y67_27320 [Mesorhizobium sp.]TIM43745.1 MAG: hypothetical protein E5Y56_17260 [Mesorhizobium sp.]TIN40655.1 MAG: hypothetical protein E5Y32_22850 [Mesorhizobium sp.]